MENIYSSLKSGYDFAINSHEARMGSSFSCDMFFKFDTFKCSHALFYAILLV